MDTPESLVYGRREGTGAAQIFGREGNPWGAVYGRRQQDERKAAIQAAGQQKAKEERDAKMTEMLAVDPEKTFEPFNQQVQDAANGHRQRIVDYFRGGGDPNNPQFQAWAKQGWGQVNDKARKGLYIQDKIGKTMEMLGKSPYLRQDYYYPKVFDKYMDANGKGIDLDKINVNDIENIFATDPGGFDVQKYTKDFMKDMKGNVFNYIKTRVANNGLEVHDIEDRIKGGLYQNDQNTASGVREDENGQPIINANNDFINAFTSNENAARHINMLAEQTGRDKKSIIESLVRPEDGFSHDVKPSFRQSPEWYYDAMHSSAHGIRPADIPAATRRYENINAITNAFYNPDGSRRTQPTPASAAALGYLKKNVKISGGDVLDAYLVPGNNTPGSSEVGGMSVDNSPDDRVVYKVKYGTRGMPKPVATVLSSEGAGAELNSQFEQAKSEGKFTVGFDQLLNWKGVKPQDVYKGRAGLTQQNEAMKVSENEQVAKWQAGEDTDQLVGRVHDGKVIKSVKVLKQGSGPLGLFGDKPKALDVEYEDGTFGEIALDDYKQLAGVYKGESKKGSNSRGGVY